MFTDPNQLKTERLTKKCGNGELAEFFKQNRVLQINFGTSDERGMQCREMEKGQRQAYQVRGLCTGLGEGWQDLELWAETGLQSSTRDIWEKTEAGLK